jgi:DivIVA domain-containing protein
MGYRFRDVDQLLGLIADLVDAEVSPSIALAAARIRRSPRGYDIAEVDRFLDRVRVQTAVWPSSPRRSAVTVPAVPATLGPEQLTPTPARAAAANACGDIDLAAAEAVAQGAGLVEALLQQRGAMVTATDARRIAEYLLAPGRAGADPYVEVRRGAMHPPIVLRAHEVLSAMACEGSSQGANAGLGVSGRQRNSAAVTS